ncbi:MAG TPA: hypothetical protein VG406_23485 [Isosphaeraceae bacterium]|nr:hypothetical protein [Isosphaeraceae bacterium]
MARSGRGFAWRTGLGGLVAGLALAWALGGRGLTAQAVPKSRPEAETIAFTSNGPGGVPLLYVVDTREKAFAIYRFDPSKNTVKLAAARPYQWDLKLDFNNEPPLVGDIEKHVTRAPAGR